MPDVPDLVAGGQVKIGAGLCPAIGEGIGKINGSLGVEGPAVVGAPLSFPMAMGTLMVGPLMNADPNVKPPIVPGALCAPGVPHNPYSLTVNGDAAVFWNLDVAMQLAVGGMSISQLDVWAFCGKHRLSQKKNLHKSCKVSLKYVDQAISSAPGYGKGNGPLNHLASFNLRNINA